MDATKVLSEFVYNLKFEDLTEHDLDYTKLLILDYYAAVYAGIKVNRVFNKANETVVFANGGTAESSVINSNKKLPAMSASYMNAVYAHGADMDDGHRKAMGHVAAHIMPSVFALAETLNVSGREVITAIAAGYEIYIRVAAAAQPGLVHRGFHSTGTAGAVACAAACAKLLRLNEEGIYNAMAVSVTQASGLMIIAESGQMIKPINPAKAAQTGILSALLVKNGVEGGVMPLDSKKGWFHAMTDSVDYSMITNDLGRKLQISTSYFKPYPSCRHTHCGIEAAVNLNGRFNYRDITEVNLYIYKNAIQIAGQIVVPKTPDDSKFSIHYSLACAIVNGGYTLDDLDTSKNPEAVDLTSKIHLIEDETMENRDKGIRGAKLEIKLSDGRILTNTVLIPKGDPENAFTLEDMKTKMDGCTVGILSAEQQKDLFDYVLSLDNIGKFYLWNNVNE